MTFRVRHEWPERPTRLLTAETSVCPHCGTLRVVEEGRETRYLRRSAKESERNTTVEPPCLEAPPDRRAARW
jgi:hypothetical protein